MIRCYLVRSVGWYLVRPHRFIQDFVHEFLAFMERGQSGWAYEDLNQADVHLARIMSGMLRHLDQHTFGVAEEWWDGNETYRWHNFLRDHAEVMDLYRDMVQMPEGQVKANLKARIEERMLDLFEHFHQLGD